MPIDAPFFLVGTLTILAVSVGKGAFGGGLAILGVPLLSLLIDPIDAAILLAPLVAFMDLFALNAFGARPGRGLISPGSCRASASASRSARPPSRWSIPAG